jgi:Ca2+-binding EF-hand superfamily protein
VHDKATYRPTTPLLFEGREHARRARLGSTIETDDGTSRVESAPRITKKYRRDRPWLSAREVRERVREDEREARAGLRVRHSFGFNSTQTLTNPDFKMNLRSMKRIEGDKCVHTPRESMHLERVKLPKVVVVEPPKPVDYFGYGDMVKLLRPPDTLEFGCLKNWSHNSEQAGKVIIGGRRWKGDCLVDFDGQRLWMKQDELQMIERSTEPRPSTAEELKIMNRRKAAERKKKMKAKRAAQLKYNLKMEEGEENTMATEEVEEFFKQIDTDGGGTLDTEEMKLLMKRLGQPSEGKGFVAIMHELDGDQSGEVDCTEFLDWWKKAGRERREEITRYNDKRREVRELFDEVDTDGSGEVDAAEVAQLVQNLGIKMNPSELQDAMAKMDIDGSGEVEFEEFYHWWMSPSTIGSMKKSRDRMEAVKNLFDTLDDDSSGSLNRDKVTQLAKSLGAALSKQDINAAMAEMDTDGNDEVDFFEFYGWWVGAEQGVLAQAKLREEKRNAMWKKVEAIEGAYTRREPDTNMNTHKKENALRRRLEEQGGTGPRLRRCTVMEIGATLGGGTGVVGDSDNDSEDNDGALQTLLQACENNDIKTVTDTLNLNSTSSAKHIGVNDALLGVTPLMVASSHGHVDLTEELLERGANPNLEDLDDATAVQWASDKLSGSAEETELDKRLHAVITLLVAYGADPLRQQSEMVRDGFSESFTLDNSDSVVGDKLLKASDNKELKNYMLTMDVHSALNAGLELDDKQASEGIGSPNTQLIKAQEMEIEALHRHVMEIDHELAKPPALPNTESDVAIEAKRSVQHRKEEERAHELAIKQEERQAQMAAEAAKWARLSTPERLFTQVMVQKEEDYAHIRALETPT